VTATVVRDRADIHADPAALFVSALADEIADRLATRLGPHLAELVEAGALAEPKHKPAHHRRPSRGATSAETLAAHDDGLWSAGRVAEHYDVAVRFIYQHADELGCVRLGGGVRPRLRFDPNTVKERWPQVGDSLPATPPARRSPAKRRQTRDRPGRPHFELLEFDREP
jgi:hypothetical protein